MQILKNIILALILFISIFIGFLLSKKYKNRVLELKELRNSLNIFKTKIKFTYEPLNEIFDEIYQNCTLNKIGMIFKIANENMKSKTTNDSWKNAIELANTNLNSEDKNILKSLGKLLGQTDIEGQISEIELTENFIDIQIKKAEEEKQKNEKLYKTLGTVIGLAIVIMLI